MKKPKPTRSERALEPIIHHVDDQVVVVDKPAGLTTMRHPEEAAEFGRDKQRFLPKTLADILPALLMRSGKLGWGSRLPRLIPVHRIDKETSGLVVFARTNTAERHLGAQFRKHSVNRRYLALVRGQAQPGRIESDLVRNRGDGRRGSGSGPGQHAVTQVRVLETLGDFTYVECRLETGRTHQVRIHLGERGTPLCGDRLYDRPVHGQPLPDASGATRIMLHAAHLAFDHPATGQRCHFEAPLPADFSALLRELRDRYRRH